MKVASIRGVAFALIMPGGCFGPSSIDCPHGGVCPPGLQCAIVGGTEFCVAPTCGNDRIEADGGCEDWQSHDGCSSRCSIETPSWTTTEVAPPRRFGQAMAYDAARGKVVMFEGDPKLPMVGDTWEWDGALWRERMPRTVPPVYIGHAMAFDAAHERIVMFGGSGVNSTWEWDGADWNERRPTTSPPALLSDPSMAYDAARQRVVLFGGETLGDAHLFRDQTWEWDGATWRMITTMGPPRRTASAMTYDSKRGKIVLFGGVNDNGVLGDTWEYDGTTWAQPSVSDAPGPRQYAGMAFDAARGKVVMFGGDTGGVPNILYTDTWEWDGTQWTAKATTVAPQMVAPMVYDVVHGKVVLVGAHPDNREIFSETWEWDGKVWAQRAVGCSSCGSMNEASTLAGRPSRRSRQALAYDTTRATTVMFGGRQGGTYLSDTWVWSGVEWRDKSPTISPPARAEHAMAFDMKRNRTVMFGGATADPSDPEAVTRFDDTWEWDGHTWLERAPAIRPMARRGHAMVYDVARAKTLLIGGNASEALAFDDQCEWDGMNWTCATPALSPPMRSDFGLAYDAARGMVVLYGGRTTSGLLDDTWEWDGHDWAKRTPSMSPEARAGHALSYDATSRRVVLFGGQTALGSLNDSWEWDGISWTKHPPPRSLPPASRNHHAMVYDAARRNLVMFAGDDNTMTELGDTWFFRYEDSSVPDEACDTGFDGDGDGKIGCADPDCAGLCVRCGDGVCDAFESCRLCPTDCGVCAICGDFRSDPGETCASCPGDCELRHECGDGRCDLGEDCSKCPRDCGPYRDQVRRGG